METIFFKINKLELIVLKYDASRAYVRCRQPIEEEEACSTMSQNSNWTPKEDESLCIAWLRVSKGGATSTNPQRSRL